MPGIQLAARGPRRAEGCPVSGGEGSAAGTAPAHGHQMQLPDWPGPPPLLGKTGRDPASSTGLATARNHILQIQDQLISDPQMGLFMSFSPISPLAINAWTGRFREASYRIYFSPGDAGEERTGGNYLVWIL